MEIAEAIAIIILVVAVVVLIYYYIQSNPKAIESFRSHVPTNADADINNFFKANNDTDDEAVVDDVDADGDDADHDGMGKKIKIKLSDIDMSSFNTDAFSKKIDAFLDHKSDELIKEWSLVTTDDLSELESKFKDTTSRVDALDEDFKKFKENSEEFQKTTESKLAKIDERISELEKK